MSESQETAGRVAGIWRYPVKSMQGEELDSSEVVEHGLVGDRAYALVDVESGKVASAKNPRKWPNLFEFHASYVEPPRDGQHPSPVRITLPGGQSLTSDQDDAQTRLSSSVGRPVRLARAAAAGAVAEGYWPDHDWLDQRDEVFEFSLPAGTFFDDSPIHILTTSTLERLRALCPGSRFEVPRFRPNFLLELNASSDGFVENDWIGCTLTLGEVRLRIERPCPRCIMTTLPQCGLEKDPAILRTAVRENEGNIGVYASVLSGGSVRRSDAVRIA